MSYDIQSAELRVRVTETYPDGAPPEVQAVIDEVLADEVTTATEWVRVLIAMESHMVRSSGRYASPPPID